MSAAFLFFGFSLMALSVIAFIKTEDSFENVRSYIALAVFGVLHCAIALAPRTIQPINSTLTTLLLAAVLFAAMLKPALSAQH